MSRDLLTETLSGLRNRSSGWRESAAIWAGSLNDNDWVAQRLYFHHDLCDDQSGPFFLELSEEAKFQLYHDLAQKNLRLIALIHTHPAEWVDLSEIDKRNQLSSRVGFWSLVLPWYAREPWTTNTFGIHTRIEKGWQRLTLSEISQRLVVED